MDEWLKKVDVTYICEYYLVMRKKNLLLFVTTWTELEGIIHSEKVQRTD